MPLKHRFPSVSGVPAFGWSCCNAFFPGWSRVIQESGDEGISTSAAAEKLKAGLLNAPTQLPYDLQQLLDHLESRGSIVQVGFHACLLHGSTGLSADLAIVSGKYRD